MVYISTDDYNDFLGNQWAAGARSTVADRWASDALASAPDRAAAAEQQAAQQQADQQAALQRAQEQAAQYAAQQAAEAQRQQAEAAAQAAAAQQAQQDQAANQWAAKSYDQAATAATGVEPAPAPPPAPAPQPAPQVDVNGTPQPAATSPQATQTAAAVGPATPLPSAGSGNYVAYAWQAAQNAGLDPNVFVRQIQQESGFQPFNADGSPKQSPAGAVGIAQIVPKYHPNVDPTNPLASLDYAANLMATLLKQNGGDMARALAAYNAGQGNVDKFGGVPPFAETQSYVKTILGDAAGLGAQLAQRAQEGLGAAGQAVQDAGAGAARVVQGAVNTVIENLRPSQFAAGLDSATAYAACGPVAAIAFARAMGRNPTAQEAVQLAKQVGWTAAQGMAGPGSELSLLTSMGVPAHMENGADVNKMATDVGNGNPVIISTPGHYFVADGYDPQSGAFHVGTSGTDLRRGSEWMTLGQMQNVMGNVQATLYLDRQPGDGPSIAAQMRGQQSGNQPAQPRAQNMADFINQRVQSGQGMPTDTELGNFVLSQPPEQTAASVGTPQPIQQSSSPFDVVGNIASGLGGAVSGAVSGVGNALGGLFGRGGPGGQPPQQPTETAPGATASPFPGLPQLPTGMPPEGGGYGAVPAGPPGLAQQQFGQLGEQASAALQQAVDDPFQPIRSGIYALNRTLGGTDAQLDQAQAAMPTLPSSGAEINPYRDIVQQGVPTIVEGAQQGDVGKILSGALQVIGGVGSALPGEGGAVRAVPTAAEAVLGREAGTAAERAAAEATPAATVPAALGPDPLGQGQVDGLAALGNATTSATSAAQDALRGGLPAQATARFAATLGGGAAGGYAGYESAPPGAGPLEVGARTVAGTALGLGAGLVAPGAIGAVRRYITTPAADAPAMVQGLLNTFDGAVRVGAAQADTLLRQGAVAQDAAEQMARDAASTASRDFFAQLRQLGQADGVVAIRPGVARPAGWTSGADLPARYGLQGYYLAPEVAGVVRNTFGQASDFTRYVLNPIGTVTGAVKETILSGSPFHSLFEELQGGRMLAGAGQNPLPAVGTALQNWWGPAYDAWRLRWAPQYEAAARAGVTLPEARGFAQEVGGLLGGVRGLATRMGIGGAGGAVTSYAADKAQGMDDQAALQDALGKGLLGAAFAGAGSMVGPALFQRQVPTLKVMGWDALVRSGMSPEAAATMVNQTFGGLNLTRIARSPDVQAAARAAVFAPDLWEGMARQLGYALSPNLQSQVGNAAKGYVAATVLSGAIALEGLNKLFSGHFTNENAPGHELDLDVSRFTKQTSDQGQSQTDYVDILGVLRPFAEVGLGLAHADTSALGKFVMGRASQPLRFGLALAENKTPLGQPIVQPGANPAQAAGQIGGYVVGQEIPAGASSLVQAYQQTGPVGAGIEALTGMRTSAETDIQAALRDPSRNPALKLFADAGVPMPAPPQTLPIGTGGAGIELSPNERKLYETNRFNLLQQTAGPLATNPQFVNAPIEARQRVMQRVLSQADQVAGRQTLAAIAQSSDLRSRVQTGAGLRPPVPLSDLTAAGAATARAESRAQAQATRPPLPMTELQPAAAATPTLPTRPPLPITADEFADLDPVQAAEMRRRRALGLP